MYGPTYGAWRATRRAPFRTNTCEEVARSLKMNVDGTASRGAGMDRSFPMWTRSRDAKSVTSVHSRGKGRRIPPLSAGVNRTPVPLMRLSSPPSSHCGFPAGPTVELRPNVHRRGTSGRPSADGVASGSYYLRREKRALKLPAFVGCDLLVTAETSNPDGDEDLRDCLGTALPLRERECLGPSGLPVDGSETIQTSSGPTRSICT
jgi:hypothetical protein